MQGSWRVLTVRTAWRVNSGCSIMASKAKDREKGNSRMLCKASWFRKGTGGKWSAKLYLDVSCQKVDA